MIVRSLLVGALVLVPATIARADGCRNPGNPPAPAPQSAPMGAPTGALPTGAHGGTIVVLGATQSRFEVAHDASSGKVTVYSVATPSHSFAIAQAPVIKLDDGRELTLVAVPGETHVWSVSDDAFRSGALAGRLMIRTNDRWESAALTAPAAPDAPATAEAPKPADASGAELPKGPEAASPAIPTGWQEPIAAHGGKILAACGGSFEFVRDPATGKATLFLLTQGASKLTLDGNPVLAVKSAAGDVRTFSMEPVTGQADSWEVSVDVFKGDVAPEGTVKVAIGGRPCELNLAAAPAPAAPPADALPAGDRPLPPAPRADEAPAAPVEPRDDKVAPPEAPGVKTPGGDRKDLPEDTASATTALVFGGGIAKLDLRRDAALGTLTLTTPTDVRAARLDGAPVLVLETPAGKKELTFEKGAADGTWTLTSDDLKATSPMKGVVRISIEGKQLEADAAPQFAAVEQAPSDMR
jgi:hypothetical protein